jgi:hypothetical protein
VPLAFGIPYGELTPQFQLTASPVNQTNYFGILFQTDQPPTHAHEKAQAEEAYGLICQVNLGCGDVQPA